MDRTGQRTRDFMIQRPQCKSLDHQERQTKTENNALEHTKSL